MDAIDELRRAQAALSRAESHAVLARMRRDKAVRAAYKAKIRPSHIAEVIGVSAGRVTQIVGKRPDNPTMEKDR